MWLCTWCPKVGPNLIIGQGLGVGQVNPAEGHISQNRNSRLNAVDKNTKRDNTLTLKHIFTLHTPKRNPTTSCWAQHSFHMARNAMSSCTLDFEIFGRMFRCSGINNPYELGELLNDTSSKNLVSQIRYLAES